jgi:glycosyltransferase involved in cell wall biosynthesis
MTIPLAEQRQSSAESRDVPEISVILPVFNEKDNLRVLITEINAALAPLGRTFEIIAVDDGSTDGSRELLLEIATDEPALKVACLRRNCGQAAALDAGFRLTAGQIIATLDADRQNDPADIPRLIRLLEEKDLDFVSGQRLSRQDPFLLRTLPSAIANFLIRRVTGTKIRDLGCALKVYRREVIDEIHLYGEMHRFIAVLAEGMGAKSAQAEVNHRPRTSGRSKYGLARTFKVILDLMTVWFMRGFQTKPIYVFGSVSLLLGIASVIMSAFVLYQKLINHIFVHLQPLFVVSMMFAVMSVQFLGMGLIAELIVRIYFESRGKPPYIISKTSGFDRGFPGAGMSISSPTLRDFLRPRPGTPPRLVESK